MPVYKRGEIWWYDFTVKGERFRGSTGARTKEVALKLERREYDAALLGDLHKPLTLEEATDLWFIARKAGRKDAANTARRIQILLRHIPGATPLADIGARTITEAMNARRFEPILRGKNRKDTGKLPTNSTINRDLIDSTLRPIMRYASRNLEAKVKDIPWSDLRLSEPRGVVIWFTDEQIDAWAEHLPHWHRPVLRFMLRYGVRLKEAFFDFNEAVHDGPAGMDIYTRNRKNGPHVVALLDEDAKEMRARIGRARAFNVGRPAAEQLTTPWFREMKDGSLRPIHWRGFQSASDLALDRAGINARPAHDARHHAGTMLLRLSKGDLASVKELLGHEAIQSTMRYAHTSRDDLRTALRHAYATPEAEDGENLSGNNGKKTA